MSSTTVYSYYQWLKGQLAAVANSSAQAEAEALLILENELGVSSTSLYTDESQTLPDATRKKLDALLDDRIQRRIPIQYIFHRAWFYGLPLYVNPHVLIPRPETELLVEAVTNQLIEKAPQSDQPLSILDVGTGSGAIALGLAKACQDKNLMVTISAVDISSAALSVAKLNAKKLGYPIHLLPAGDLLAPLASSLPEERRFDAIVSNPPYIDDELKSTLSPEVLWHEPFEALFPPSPDAYYFYRRLAAEAKTHLNPNGLLAVEVGIGMTDLVKQIFIKNGYTNVRVLPDYAGINRIVQANQADARY